MYTYISGSAEFVGRGDKRAYARAWYASFREMSLRLGEMDEIPFADDPSWLTMPIARREAALHRRNVMLAYERHKQPGEAEAQKAASEMGLTTGQFYRLRRQWKESRSVFSLIPFGRPGSMRKPKLDPDVSSAVQSLIMEAIKNDGFRSPAQILNKIQLEWQLEKPAPSHMTLRKHINEALVEVEDLAGNIVVQNRVISNELLNDANHFGDLLVIDHVGLCLFVSQTLGPVAPIATLAIDVFTSSICGFHLSVGYPNPDQVLAVLRNTETRMSVYRTREVEPSRPHLVLECGRTPPWDRLIDLLEERGNNVAIRRSHDVVRFGEIINRLIGVRIGAVGLGTPNLLWPRRSFDPTVDPLVSAEELNDLFAKSVEEINQKRIPDALVRRPMWFNI